MAVRDRMRAERPGQPWAWRKDWAAARIAGGGRSGAIPFLVFGLVWNAITWPVAWLFIRNEDDPNVFTLLLFPAIGVLLIVAGTRRVLKARKYGTSYLVLQTSPGVPGRSLQGYVETSLQAAPPEGVQVGLRCDHERVTGTGKHRSRSSTTLWQDHVTVEALELERGAKGLRIPVSFAIPTEAHAYDDHDPDDAVRWYVAVEAKLPGLDYDDTFDVPVFATGDPPLPQAERDALQRRRTMRAQSYTPATPLFRVSQTSRGGRVFSFAPKIKTAQATGAVLVTVASWTAVWWLFTHGVVAASLIVAFFGLLFTLGTAVAVFHRSSVTIEDGAMTLRHRVLGVGTTRRVEVGQVAEVRSKAVGGGNARSWEVEVRVAGGAVHSAAALFESQRDADWVVGQLWAAIGGPR
jgi:hypothetical protein